MEVTKRCNNTDYGRLYLYFLVAVYVTLMTFMMSVILALLIYLASTYSTLFWRTAGAL